MTLHLRRPSRAGVDKVVLECSSDLIKAAQLVLVDAYYVLEPDKDKRRKPAAGGSEKVTFKSGRCQCAKPELGGVTNTICTACHKFR